MTKIILAILLAGQFALANSPPVAPTYESCTPMDLSCQRRNDAARNNYNAQLVAYGNAYMRNPTPQQSDTGAEISNTPVEQPTNTNATAQIQEAIKQNKDGSSKYGTMQKVTMATSVALLAAYGVSCMSGCMQPLLYGSMAFGVFSMLAKGRKEKHNESAYDSCVAQAQLSATAGTSCERPADGGSTPTTFPPTGTALTEVFPVNPDGTCTGTAEQCQAIRDSLPPGVSIRDAVNGLSSFANGGKPLFTVNPDGTVIDKNGKKISPDTFSSAKGLASLGLSPSAASSLLSDLNKSGASGLGKDGDKAKTAGLSDKGKDVGGTFGDSMMGGQTISVNNDGPNGDAANSGKDIAGASRNNARDLASAEGLVKDFNGELIGVAGDDIFKMMNRRYILKDTQDSFIAPVAP